MDLFKYFERLKYLHYLIKSQATGTPKELSKKLNLSERHVREYIAQMKELGAPISYNKRTNSYYYLKETHFEIGFKVLSENELIENKGGFSFSSKLIFNI